MKASRFSPLSRGSFVHVRSESIGWSRRYCAFSAAGRDFHSGAIFVRRCLCLRLGCVSDLDVGAADRLLAGFPDPLEIPRVRTASAYGVVEAIAEAVRQDRVVHGRLAALFLGDREVLEGGHPVAPPVAPVIGDRLEVARASKLLGAEAFGHHASELRDVTLLGCLDEGSLHAEFLQPGCNGSAACRIPVDARHVPTLCARRPRSRWVEECAAWCS
jgi:hypothetical protein